MKRFASALLATLVLGGSVPAVLAHDDDDQDSRWRTEDSWRTRDYDDDDHGTTSPWRDGDRDRRRSRNRNGGVFRGSHNIDPRMYNDPLFQALNDAHGIQVNNFYDGGRYRTSGQTFNTDIVRIERINRDGTYDVWFNGRSYPAFTRTYKGRMLLYVGSAPTNPGWLYELVLR
jgi:hypothetical protein